MNRRAFKRGVNQALRDQNLQTAMSRATTIFRIGRLLTFRNLDVSRMRADLRAVKEESIARLPELVERFTAEAQAVGAQVYAATDGAAANAYVADLASAHGVTLAVKSKSMVTEEIGLNAYLAARGVKAVETDLGEWIVQLADEHPSHMLAPAIHKPREEVARLFSHATGHEVSGDDIGNLVAVARRELRQTFVDAGLGISGANIGIANTGTLVIVSNEGNARLVTTLPPVHVAVVGVEKLVPSLPDAAKVLEILPPSATGQKISSYVSFITGPSRTADIEVSLTVGVHGPKELHIVLLDNGRYRLREDPDFREALYCVKCAACLNVCPVYAAVGGHAYGHTYVGGIGAILTAFFEGLGEAANPAELCLGCGACQEVCPAQIDIPRLILRLRDRLGQTAGVPFLQHLLYSRLLNDGRTLRRLHTLGRVAQAPLARQGFIRGVPFSEQARARSLPVLSPRPLRARVDRALLEKPGTGRALFYSGCLIEHVYPEIGEAVVRVLDRAGLSVALLKEQPCCGVPARYAGDRPAAVAAAKHNLAVLEGETFDQLVVACPTCGQAFLHEYPELLADDPLWAARARAVAAKTVDFTQIVAANLDRVMPADSARETGDDRSVEPEVLSKPKVTYHDPCHLRRHLGVVAEPREILGRLPDLEFAEIGGGDACCGFGGTFSAKYPAVSAQILDRRLADVEGTGAETVVTACPGCLMQLRGGLDKRQSTVKVRHLAEVLAERLPG